MALRSLRLVVAIIVTLVVGLVACATFAVIAVGALNPISAAFAVLFIGIAVDFGIQFSVRYRDERFRADSFDIALRRTATGIGGPLAVAAAATSVGFFSFVPTDYTGVSDLGLIAGVGMLVALGLNVTLLPALLTLLRPRGERRAVGFARLAPLDRLLVERRRLVLAGAAVAALGAAALLPALRFDFNPLDLQNQRTEAMQVLNEMKADPDQTPYTAEILTPSISAARELADRLGKLDAVERAITAASFVPEDQPAKLAILADITSVLGITLIAARGEAAAERRRGAEGDRVLRRAPEGSGWPRVRGRRAARGIARSGRRARRRGAARAARRARIGPVRPSRRPRRVAWRRAGDVRDLARRCEARLDRGRRKGARPGLPQGRRARQRGAAALRRSGARGRTERDRGAGHDPGIGQHRDPRLRGRRLDRGPRHRGCCSMRCCGACAMWRWCWRRSRSRGS